MKKFLTSVLVFFILSICILLTSLSPKQVYSASLYYRVLSEDTPFYTDTENQTPLFYLPYSYYVKILDVSGSFARVECSSDSLIAIDGFVPVDMLYEDNQTVIKPYIDLTITTATTAVLYSDKTLQFPIQYIFKNRNLHYYGSIIHGQNERLYYVGYNGKLGYVKEADVMPFDIPLHSNPLPEKEDNSNENYATDKQGEVTSKSKIGDKTLRLIIVIALGTAGLIGLFIALKNKRNTQNSTACSYYDESDYE